MIYILLNFFFALVFFNFKINLLFILTNFYNSYE